jgi:hypothetical protein
LKDSLYNVEKSAAINELTQKYSKVENEKTIGELNIGDTIFDKDGQQTTVLAKSKKNFKQLMTDNLERNSVPKVRIFLDFNRIR